MTKYVYCSLYTLLTATDQKQQNHNTDIQAMLLCLFMILGHV